MNGWDPPSAHLIEPKTEPELVEEVADYVAASVRAMRPGDTCTVERHDREPLFTVQHTPAEVREP